jgi:hypothetical protein
MFIGTQYDEEPNQLGVIREQCRAEEQARRLLGIHSEDRATQLAVLRDAQWIRAERQNKRLRWRLAAILVALVLLGMLGAIGR